MLSGDSTISFSCNDVRARWVEYLYRELDEPEQGKFVQHLRRCPQCHAEDSQWRDLLSRFDGMSVSDGNAEPPRELVFRVKRQVRLYEDWSQQTFAQFRNWLVGSATACAILLGGIWTMQDQLLNLSNPETLLKSISKPTLEYLYNKDTLRILHAEGLFDTENPGKSNIVADLADVTDNSPKPARESAGPASRKQS